MKGRKIKSLKMFFVMLILLLPCMCFTACLNGGDKTPADNTEYDIEFELYNINGDARVDIKREYVFSGKKATAPSDDSFSHNEGFSVDGWYTDKAFTKKFDFEDAISADITLYGRQKWLELTVTFVNDKGIAPDSVKAMYGDMLTTLPIFDDIGFETFSGWYTDKDFENEFTLESRVKQNLTLYAKWQYKKFEMTFVYDEYKRYNEVAYKDDIKTYTDRIETSASSSGIADGWFLDAEFTKPVNLQQYEVNADATLYLRLRVDYFNKLKLIELDDGTYKATGLWLTPKAGEAYYIPGEFVKRDGTKCIISTIGKGFIHNKRHKALVFGKEITKVEEGAFAVGSKAASNLHFMASSGDITFEKDYATSSGRDFMHTGCGCKIEGDYLYQQDDETSVSITSYLGNAGQVLLVPASLANKTVKGISQGAFDDVTNIIVLPGTIEVASGYISNASSIICAFSEAKANSGMFNENWSKSFFDMYTSVKIVYDAIVLEADNHYYYELNNNAIIVAVKDLSQLSDVYTTPSTLGELPVTEIFKLKIRCPDKSIIKVVIGDSITSINKGALDFEYVEAIHFGSGITKILGNYFTLFDSYVKEITYSPEITDFDILSSLPHLVEGFGSPWYMNLPDGDVYINNILLGYKGLMPDKYHLDIRQGTKYIASSAFYNETIFKVTIPDSVIGINEKAFLQCDFTNVFIPDNVVTILDGAFSCGVAEKFTISCGATAKPIGWHDNWSWNSPEILWGQARPTE